MPEVPSPDWWSWGFWAQDPASIREFVITIAALVGIPFVVWREWLHHRQTNAARQQAATAQLRHEAQIEADRERRITDSFTRAIEQLGSEKLATRLGAIYALEHMAQESRDRHWSIMETLTAYIREHAAWRLDPTTESDGGMPRPAADVQASLTVVSRRDHEYDRARQRLNLANVDLRLYKLENAHLERAFLANSHLRCAVLSNAHLQEAILHRTNLKDATLRKAHLERAWCQRSHFEGADFTGAHLEGADLRNTDLTQKQFDSAISDENTKVPPHINRQGKLDGEVAETPHEGKAGTKPASRVGQARAYTPISHCERLPTHS